MELITFFLAFIWIVKIVAISQVLPWLYRNGAGYRKALTRISKNKKKTNSQEAFYDSLDAFNGRKVFPFGVNDYLLRRFVETSKNRFAKGVAWIVLRLLFRGINLTWMTALWLYLVTAVPQFSRGWIFLSYQQHLGALYFLAILPLVGVLTLNLETIFSLTSVQSYAWAFQMKSPSHNVFFDEMRQFSVLLFRAVLTSSIAAYATAMCMNGLGGSGLVAASVGELFPCLKLFVQCLYFAMSTITSVAFGDIYPTNGWGQATAFLIMLVSFSLLIFVYTSVTQIRLDLED